MSYTMYFYLSDDHEVSMTVHTKINDSGVQSRIVKYELYNKSETLLQNADNATVTEKANQLGLKNLNISGQEISGPIVFPFDKSRIRQE